MVPQWSICDDITLYNYAAYLDNLLQDIVIPYDALHCLTILVKTVFFHTLNSILLYDHFFSFIINVMFALTYFTIVLLLYNCHTVVLRTA